MTFDTISFDLLSTYLLNAVRNEFFAGLMIALLSGWGGIMISERWARKRERAAQRRERLEAKRSRLMDHLTELVKWYQVNVRLLRQDPKDRSTTELDLAHASFIAQVKLLSIEPKLKDDTEVLIQISRLMSQLWPAELAKSSRDTGLEKIYTDFAKTFDSLVKNIDELTD